MAEFKGFFKETLTFFNQLAENNNKEWFDQHKKGYEQYVRQPSEQFVVALGERLRTIAPGIHAVPKTNQSLFRLNRDTRFSHDKRPYKTNLGILLWEGERKKMACTGFYFHLERGKLMMGAGMHLIPKPLLGPFRDAVVHEKHGPKLKDAIKKVSRHGYTIGTKHYKKTPRGYDEAHENADFLLYNGLFAMYEAEIPEELFSKKLLTHAFSHYKKMAPLHTWLLDALG